MSLRIFSVDTMCVNKREVTVLSLVYLQTLYFTLENSKINLIQSRTIILINTLDNCFDDKTTTLNKMHLFEIIVVKST